MIRWSASLGSHCFTRMISIKSDTPFFTMFYPSFQEFESMHDILYAFAAYCNSISSPHFGDATVAQQIRIESNFPYMNVFVSARACDTHIAINAKRM